MVKGWDLSSAGSVWIQPVPCSWYLRTSSSHSAFWARVFRSAAVRGLAGWASGVLLRSLLYWRALSRWSSHSTYMSSASAWAIGVDLECIQGGGGSLPTTMALASSGE